MKAEKFIELIEQKRFDKISKNGMTLIAERFRQLQTKQLSIQGVGKSLRVSKKTYTEEDVKKAYKYGANKGTYRLKNGTVILPADYEGVDG